MVLRFCAIATLMVFGKGSASQLRKGGLGWCGYWERLGKLDEHPECRRHMPKTTSTTEEPQTLRPMLSVCAFNAALVQCSSDPIECPNSGQICTQTNGEQCCQGVSAGISVSDINAKGGSCPQPLGISALQDTTVGCWLDSGCPGIQKCCIEPNTVTNTATRICRDPIGISSTSICNLPLAVGSCTAPSIRYYYDSSSGRCNSFQYSGCGGNANNFQSLSSCQATCSAAGRLPLASIDGSWPGRTLQGRNNRPFTGITGTPTCPADANAGLNCLFAHADACNSDSDCLGRENTVQPSCCLTTCGYKICYQY